MLLNVNDYRSTTSISGKSRIPSNRAEDARLARSRFIFATETRELLKMGVYLLLVSREMHDLFFFFILWIDTRRSRLVVEIRIRRLSVSPVFRVSRVWGDSPPKSNKITRQVAKSRLRKPVLAVIGRRHSHLDATRSANSLSDTNRRMREQRSACLFSVRRA